MFVNIINSYRKIIAICDSELLGKRFEEGKFQLDIKENFFANKNKEKFSELQVIEILKDMKKEDATFYIIGEKAIETAIKSGIISNSEESIKKIDNIPFTILLL